MYVLLWTSYYLILYTTYIICSIIIRLSLDSHIRVALELVKSPRIWWCGIGGFQDQVQCFFVGLVALYFFVFNYFPFLFFSSIGW